MSDYRHKAKPDYLQHRQTKTWNASCAAGPSDLAAAIRIAQQNHLPATPATPANCVPITSKSVLYRTQVAILSRATRPSFLRNYTNRASKSRKRQTKIVCLIPHQTLLKKTYPTFPFKIKKLDDGLLLTEMREIVPNFQQKLYDIGAEKQNEKKYQVINTV